MEFTGFPKIGRLFREIVITEKIDGTNAAIQIEETMNPRAGHMQRNDSVTIQAYSETLDKWFNVRAQSRTRFITPEDDNYGFGRWVFENADKLVSLGAGVHFGEWWGNGIQRAYGLTNGDKRFSLFNTGRWVESDQGDTRTVIPEITGLYVVPTLWRGNFNAGAIGDQIDILRKSGSFAAPGFMRPEGIVIYHTAIGEYFKVTLEKDEQPKGKNR